MGKKVVNRKVKVVKLSQEDNEDMVNVYYNFTNLPYYPEEGRGLLILSDNASQYMKTSKVESIEYLYNGFIINTRNSRYRITYLGEIDKLHEVKK